jgi:hypothetical protein
MQAQVPPSGLPAVGKQVTPGPLGEAAEGVLRPGEVTAEGDVAVEEQDPAERLRGLDAFARQGNTAALQQGLLDPDEGVRMQALGQHAWAKAKSEFWCVLQRSCGRRHASTMPNFWASLG